MLDTENLLSNVKSVKSDIHAQTKSAKHKLMELKNLESNLSMDLDAFASVEHQIDEMLQDVQHGLPRKVQHQMER